MAHGQAKVGDFDPGCRGWRLAGKLGGSESAGGRRVRADLRGFFQDLLLSLLGNGPDFVMGVHGTLLTADEDERMLLRAIADSMQITIGFPYSRRPRPTLAITMCTRRATPQQA